MITIYGASWCGPCKRVKAHLEKIGKEYVYKDISIEENVEELKNFGYSSIPLIVSGETHISGYKPEELDKL